jgi:hypothetical protein
LVLFEVGVRALDQPTMGPLGDREEQRRRQPQRIGGWRWGNPGERRRQARGPCNSLRERNGIASPSGTDQTSEGQRIGQTSPGLIILDAVRREQRLKRLV